MVRTPALSGCLGNLYVRKMYERRGLFFTDLLNLRLISGAPEVIRTPYLLFRRQTLYPDELQAQNKKSD